MLTNEHDAIGLREFISRVKEELLEEFDQEFPLFLISGIELEIAFTVERNINGGVDFKVLKAGVDKKMINVQTVKVQLEPIVSSDELRMNLNPDEKNKAKAKLVRDFKENSR